MTKQTEGTKMVKANPTTCQAAVDAGYWISRDHGEWFVGKDAGINTKRFPERFRHRKDALQAMVIAHVEAR